MKSWNQVVDSDAFGELSIREQEAARQQYFAQVVAPKAPAGEVDDVRAQFDAQTKDTGVDDLLTAITHRESNGNPNAVGPVTRSGERAQGSVQIMPGTFKTWAKPGEDFNSDTDRRTVARRMIEDDYNFYGGDLRQTAAAYIGGRGAVNDDGSIKAVHDGANGKIGTYAADYADQVVNRINNTPAPLPAAYSAAPITAPIPAPKAIGANTAPAAAKPDDSGVLDAIGTAASSVYHGVKDNITSLFSDPTSVMSSSLAKSAAAAVSPENVATATALLNKRPSIQALPDNAPLAVPSKTSLASLAKVAGQGLESSSAGVVVAAELALGQAPAAAVDWLHSALSGKDEDAAQKWAKDHFVDPAISAQKFFALSPEDRANPVFSMAYAITSALGAIPSMVATSGAAGEATAVTAATKQWEMMANSAAHGAKVMAPTAYLDGVNRAKELIDQGASFQDAITGGTTKALFVLGTGGAPISAEGSAFMRVVTGAPLGALQGELARRVDNAAIAGRPDLQSEFTKEGLAQSTVTGAMMGLTMGDKGDHIGARAGQRMIADTINSTNLHGDTDAAARSRLDPQSYDPAIVDPNKTTIDRSRLSVPNAPAIEAAPVSPVPAEAHQPAMPTGNSALDQFLALRPAPAAIDALHTAKDQAIAEATAKPALQTDPAVEGHAVTEAPSVDEAIKAAEAIASAPIKAPGITPVDGAPDAHANFVKARDEAAARQAEIDATKAAEATRAQQEIAPIDKTQVKAPQLDEAKPVTPESNLADLNAQHAELIKKRNEITESHNAGDDITRAALQPAIERIDAQLAELVRKGAEIKPAPKEEAKAATTTKAEPAAPVDPTVEPPAPVTPAGRIEAHTMTRDEYRNAADRGKHGGFAFAKINLDNETVDSLLQHPAADIMALGTMTGAKGGKNLTKVATDTLRIWQLRGELSTATADGLVAAHSLPELKALAKRADVYTGLPKKALADSIIGWRDAQRKQTQDRLQDAKHHSRVSLAIEAGKTVSPEVMHNYPEMAVTHFPKESPEYKAGIEHFASKIVTPPYEGARSRPLGLRQDAAAETDPKQRQVLLDIADAVDTKLVKIFGADSGPGIDATIVAKAKEKLATDEATPAAPAPEPAPIVPPAPKKPGSTAASRLTESNPFLAFLGKHGVNVADRSDTGGESGGGRGATMIPGFGPLYRKNAPGLDILATLAHEAGFLTSHDMDSDLDNGGVNKLTDMIERAAHKKEMIVRPDAAGAEDEYQRQHDAHQAEEMAAELKERGIDPSSMTVDEMHTALQAEHIKEVQAESVDEYDAIVQDADHVGDPFTAADINELARIATSDERIDSEDIHAQSATDSIRQADGIDAEAPRPGHTGIEATPGSQGTDGFALDGESHSEGTARLTAEEAAARTAAKAEKDAAAAERDARIKKEIDARQISSAEHFQLGESAEQGLSGQGGMFEDRSSRQLRTEAALRAVAREEGTTPDAVREKYGYKDDADYVRLAKLLDLEIKTPEDTRRDEALGRAVDSVRERQGVDSPSPIMRTSALLRMRQAFRHLEANADDPRSQSDFVNDATRILEALEQKRAEQTMSGVAERERGADIIREKLLAAKRRGEISPELADMAEWFVQQNPALVDGLGISVRSTSEHSTAAGQYNPAARIMSIFKGHANDTTGVHEILHHLERLMPVDMQKAIQAEYLKQIAAKMANPKTSDGTRAYLEQALKAYTTGSAKEYRKAGELIGGAEPGSYQFFNPSEFWAVNATDLVARRYDAQGSAWRQIKDWTATAIEKVKGAIGMRSDAPIIKALQHVMGRADGVADPKAKMLSDMRAHNDLRDQLSKVLKVPREFIKAPLDDIRTAITPMSMGSADAQVMTTRFADGQRWARHQWNKFDTVLVKEFTKAQQEKMWTAADEENDLRRDGITDPTRGLGSLASKERQVVELFHAYGEELLQKARDNGMFEGDGVPFWTPRIVMMIDGEGQLHLPPAREKGESSNEARNLRTTSNNLKGRKYLTSADTEAAAQSMNDADRTAMLVKNIRTMPMAMAKLESAIAGRELVNQVKALGQATGRATVATGKAGDAEFFTMAHPALMNTRPEMTTDPVTGKTVPKIDQNGNMVFKREPLYISKEFEGPLKAVLNRKSLPGYQAFAKLKSESLGLIMLSPMIHMGVEWGRSMPAMLTSVGKRDAAANLLTLGAYTYVRGNFAKRDNAQMRFAIEHGLVPIGGQGQNVDLQSIQDGATMKPGKSLLSQGLGRVADAVIGLRAGENVRTGIDRIGKFVHETLLWDRIGDLQMGLFSTMHASLVAKGVDESTAATMAAHWANRYAGALPAEAMGQYAREIANVAMFSRSFTLGNMGLMKDMVNGLPPNRQAMVRANAIEAMREIGMNDHEAGEVGDNVLKNAKQIARGKAQVTVALDIALSYVATAAMQDWIERMKGEKTWGQQVDQYKSRLGAMADHLKADPGRVLSHPFDALDSLTPQGHNPIDKRDRSRVGDDKEGNTIYVRLPLGKVGEELKAYTDLGTLSTKLSAKLSPQVAAAYQAFNGEDHFKRKIYTDADGGLTKIGKAMVHFMKAQVPYDQAVAIKDVAKGTIKRTDISDMDKAKAFGPFAGVTFSKEAGGDLRSSQLAAMRDFTERKTAATVEAKAFIKDGNEDGARKVFEDIGMTGKEINTAMRTIIDPSHPLAPATAKKIYKHATDAQRESIDEQPGR